MKRSLASGLALLAVTAVVGGEPETPNFVSNFGDWHVRCFAAKQTAPCDMIYAVYRQATSARVVSVSILYSPDRKTFMVQIAVPLGIAVQKGVVIAMDDARSAAMQVRRCDGLGCYVEGPADPALIAALAAHDGRKARLAVVGDNGKAVALPLSLNGFAQAKGALLVATIARGSARPAPAPVSSTVQPRAATRTN